MLNGGELEGSLTEKLSGMSVLEGKAHLCQHSVRFLIFSHCPLMTRGCHGSAFLFLLLFLRGRFIVIL